MQFTREVAAAPTAEFLNATELAKALRCCRTYVEAMKRGGFVMPGGRATVSEARQWLREHPHFRITEFYLSKKRRDRAFVNNATHC